MLPAKQRHRLALPGKRLHPDHFLELLGLGALLQGGLGLLPLLAGDLVADARPVLEHRRLEHAQHGDAAAGAPRPGAGVAQRRLGAGGVVEGVEREPGVRDVLGEERELDGEFRAPGADEGSASTVSSLPCAGETAISGSPAAALFVRSRLGGAHGLAFGTLPDDERPTPAQVKGFAPIVRGASTLLLAPTGSGKTLAAFLSAIDDLVRERARSERLPALLRQHRPDVVVIELGGNDAAIRALVQSCGYSNARLAGGLMPTGPFYGDGVPPADGAYGIRVLGAPDNGPVTLQWMQSAVTAATAPGPRARRTMGAP